MGERGSAFIRKAELGDEGERGLLSVELAYYHMALHPAVQGRGDQHKDNKETSHPHSE